jgi:hypothetical protein
MLATINGVAHVWDDRRIAGRPWPPAEWDQALAELRASARGAPAEILTYDTEAPWIWSFTGARVFSLWLPGPIKLGFDPLIYTGLGYLDRVRLTGDAFDNGLDGVCALAADRGITTVLLRSLEDLVATHDHAFAAPFRTDPAERSERPPTRKVGPGITYVDTGPDWLQVQNGVEVPIPFAAPAVRTVVVEVRNVAPGARVRLTVRSGDKERHATADSGTGVQAIRFDLPSRTRRDDLTIQADEEILLLRVLGYEQVDFAHPRDGAFVSTTDSICGLTAGRELPAALALEVVRGRMGAGRW